LFVVWARTFLYAPNYIFCESWEIEIDLYDSDVKFPQISGH